MRSYREKGHGRPRITSDVHVSQLAELDGSALTAARKL